MTLVFSSHPTCYICMAAFYFPGIPCAEAMPSRRSNTRAHRDVGLRQQQALNQIPIPPATIQQTSNFLNHIAKVFYFLLQEFLNSQTELASTRGSSNFQEAFHQSLFDLQVLTRTFMDGNELEHYELAARIMILTATASTTEEDNLLKFALQQLHQAYPSLARLPMGELIHWLWHHHVDSLQGPEFDLLPLQIFFDIPLTEE